MKKRPDMLTDGSFAVRQNLEGFGGGASLMGEVGGDEIMPGKVQDGVRQPGVQRQLQVVRV